MRTAMLTFLLLGLMAGAAWATGPGKKGGGGPPSRWTAVRVVNQCPDAVAVTVEDSSPVPLEPTESSTFAFFMKGQKGNATVKATLVGTSISDTERCQVEEGLTTNATVTCTTGPSGTTLTINCLAPGAIAGLGLGRESDVVLASSGALLGLLALGHLLGRMPRRRESR